MAEPWLYRWSRPLMGAIALLGLLLTAYLTWAELTGQTLICPVTANGSDCNDVLNSAYGQLWGIPISAFGAGAYGAIALAALVPLAISGQRRQIEALTWPLLLVGALIMATFSGYLMAILAFELHSFCPYCLASALFAFTLLGLSLFGHPWPDLGQLLATGGIVVVLTLVLTLGVYSQASPPVMAVGVRQPIPPLNSRPEPG
ncbi:MAG: vitamin K epoxide reductase family protein, partial [Spirulina sp. DLM2.Bin59]